MAIALRVAFCLLFVTPSVYAQVQSQEIVTITELSKEFGFSDRQVKKYPFDYSDFLFREMSMSDEVTKKQVNFILSPERISTDNPALFPSHIKLLEHSWKNYYLVKEYVLDVLNPFQAYGKLTLTNLSSGENSKLGRALEVYRS